MKFLMEDCGKLSVKPNFYRHFYDIYNFNTSTEMFREFTSGEFSKLKFVRLSSSLTEGQFVYWTSGVWYFKELISQISPPCKNKVDTFIIKRKDGQDMSNSLKTLWIRTTLALALVDTSLQRLRSECDLFGHTRSMCDSYFWVG